MKRILITGANSYIGVCFENYLQKNYPDAYSVDTVDMIDGSWRDRDFSGYDAIFHVAGIAHQKETKENAPLYYKVNRDVAVETAKKAKAEGVLQFVFLSSMSVYGKESGEITAHTPACPKTHYGRSKLEAEEGILPLASDTFRVAVVRPPMVYGKGCKGNFQTVVKLVKKLPVFPKIANERSMIYVDTLCEYIRGYIDSDACGIFLPQNAEYVNTSEMAKAIAQKLGKKLHVSRTLGLAVKLLIPFLPMAKKAFGSLTYERSAAPLANEIGNCESFMESV